MTPCFGHGGSKVLLVDNGLVALDVLAVLEPKCFHFFTGV